MQDSLRVTQQLRRFDHGGIFPNRDLVIGEAVGGNQLLEFAGPKQGANLGNGQSRRYVGIIDCKGLLG